MAITDEINRESWDKLENLYPKTKPVHNDENLATLVTGDRISLNLGVATIDAAYVDENRFVTRFPVGNEPKAASYTATEIGYDNEGAVVLKKFEAQNYDHFGQVPGMEYLALIKSGLVRE